MSSAPEQQDGLPTGTLTLLMTDIEGSTVIWEKHRDVMGAAVARHDEVLRKVVEQKGGRQLKSQGEGDSTFNVFTRATDAVAAAIDAQRALGSEEWGPDINLSVRMAIHTGEAQERSGDYYGPAVIRCARLREIAHGGQVLISRATYELTRGHLPDGVSLRDLGTHRLRDLSYPEHVYQVIASGLSDDFPSLRSLDAFPNNLPLQIKSFVPRDAEIADVKGRLAASRLVTLTGAGGSGKTRLAIEVASEMLDQFPDGVWLIDLAPITNPDLIATKVAAAVGLLQPGSAMGSAEVALPLNRRLIQALSSRTALLLFDNCEHLVTSCAELITSLLTNCPDLRVLATSREPLGVEGEATWKVPSLSMPVKEADLETLEGSQAIRLFLDRARLVKADFSLTPENAVAVIEISRRLDGVPLAIELAAARVRVLTPPQIVEKLEDQFRLLTGSSRTAVERHQTIRASIDWSYNLLDEKEKLLFSRLSNFAGGATLEAVEAVCSGEAISAPEALDLLGHLVDKSLLEFSGDRARYLMVETIRQYGRERLAEIGESEEIRRRHGDFFLALAEEAAPRLRAGDEMATLERLGEELDNLRLALEGAIDRGEAERALRLASSLSQYWFTRGHSEEGERSLVEALGISGEADPLLRAQALTEAGWLGHADRVFGDPELTMSRGQEALDLLDGARNMWAGHAFNLRAIGYLAQGEKQAARSDLDKAVEIAKEVGNGWGAAIAFLFLGDWFEDRRGSDHDEAVDLAREVGSRFLLAAMTFWTGSYYHGAGDHLKARELLEEAADLYRRLGNDRELASARNLLGYLAMARGEYEEARLAIEEAIDIARRLGNLKYVASFTHSLGELEEASGSDESAKRLFEEALRLAKQNESQGTVAACYISLAAVAHRAGEDEVALRSLHLIFELPFYRERLPPGRFVRLLAQQLVANGMLETAARVLGAHEAFSKSVGREIAKGDVADYEEALSMLRGRLGDRFQALWDEGSEWSIEEAIRHALQAADEALLRR